MKKMTYFVLSLFLALTGTASADFVTIDRVQLAMQSGQWIYIRGMDNSSKLTQEVRIYRRAGALSDAAKACRELAQSALTSNRVDLKLSINSAAKVDQESKRFRSRLVYDPDAALSCTLIGK